MIRSGKSFKAISVSCRHFSLIVLCFIFIVVLCFRPVVKIMGFSMISMVFLKIRSFCCEGFICPEIDLLFGCGLKFASPRGGS